MKSADVMMQFPVLGISSDNDLWGFGDLRGLTTCGPRTLRDNMQSGMELVDATGARWRVVAVRRTGAANPLLISWVLSLLTGTPQSRIEQDVEPLDPLSLSEVQQRVCAGMQAHPEFWCEDDERATVFPQRLEEVRRTKRIDEIHNVLGLDTFEAY